MKFDEIKNNSEPRKEYPQVKLVGKLERVIKKGTTDKGSWIVLGFKELKGSAIFFAKSKEEVDEKLENIDIGSSVQIELSGSSKGNVLKDIQKHEEGVEGESPSSSHRHLLDEDLKAYVPDSVFLNSFKCGDCGTDNVMFKQELRNFILNTVRSYHDN